MYLGLSERIYKLYSEKNILAPSQFMKCYEKTEDINPPVKLEPCVIVQGDQVSLNEPLVSLPPASDSVRI